MTLWIRRLSAMTEEKEDPAGLRGLEATARGTPRSKGRALLCSLAVRAKPHRQSRPGALTYAMARGRSEIEGTRTTVQSCRAGETAPARQTRCAHVCNGGGRSEIEGSRTTVQSCRAGEAAPARQTRRAHVCNGEGPHRDRKAAHYCAVLPCGQNRSGKADQARS